MSFLFISIALSATVLIGTMATLPRLHPRTGALALLLCSISVAFAGVWAISVPAFVYLFHTSSDGTFAGWCRTLVSHGDVPAWIGLPSLILLLLVLIRVVRRWRSLRAASRSIPQGSPITVITGEEPVAMTTPGKAGRIIVSTGLMNALTPLERRAVLAHERTHLACRHDRFLLVADLAVTAMPLVAPLNRLMRRSLERWADEAAAVEVGDRDVVARAIEIAARSTLGLPSLGSALGQSDVIARLDALGAAAPPNQATLLGALLIAVSLAVTLTDVAGTGFQFHQFLELFVHICPF
jgi:Zn-dependent protease with chaperone function